jgi:hypothetical protein
MAEIVARSIDPSETRARAAASSRETVGLKWRASLKSLVPACRYVPRSQPGFSSQHQDRLPSMAGRNFVGGSQNLVAELDTARSAFFFR